MGSESRARLGLAALLLATLVSFEQLFARSDYFGPAFLSLLLAGGLGMSARRLGIGTLVTVQVSAAALFWYLALVFEAGTTLYGLPTPAAAAGLATAVRSALAASNLDYAPIPSRAGYVILVVVGIWVATTAAEIATFRWRRPLLATLPALGLFAFDLVVADPAGSSFRVSLWLSALLTYLALESTHRLSSWGRYITTWRDQEPEPDAVTGMLARRMGAACVLAAVVAPVFLPAFENGVLAWRNPTGGSGAPGGRGAIGGRVDLLATLVPNTLEQSSLELFEVDAAEPANWRLASLTRFDGATWHPAEGDRRPASVGFTSALVPPETPARRLEQRVRITGLQSDYLPAAATPSRLEFSDGIDLSQVLLDTETQDMLYLSGVQQGLTYDVTSLLPELSYKKLARAEPGSPGDIYRAPPELSQDVEAIRDRWIQGAGGPFEQLVAIQDKLRGPAFDYSQSVERSSSTDYLTQFLTDTRKGFCQQFAAAFAVLSRSLGYPTRLSVGFLPGEVGEVQDHYIVRGSDAHAWPEVHFQGFGWVAFEPTPRSSTLTPDYTSTPFVPGTGQGRQGSGPLGDGAPVPGQARIRNESLEPGGLLAPLPASEPTAWRREFDRLALVAALLLAAWLVAVPTLKEWRRRRRYRRAQTPDGVVIASFLHFVEEASELATAPRPASESAVAYARRVAGSERGPVVPALDLATLYEGAEYGASGASPADGRRARALARLLRSRLWAKASWWERATRLFAPNGLFASAAPSLRRGPPPARRRDRAA